MSEYVQGCTVAIPITSAVQYSLRYYIPALKDADDSTGTWDLPTTSQSDERSSCAAHGTATVMYKKKFKKGVSLATSARLVCPITWYNKKLVFHSSMNVCIHIFDIHFFSYHIHNGVQHYCSPEVRHAGATSKRYYILKRAGVS